MVKDHLDSERGNPLPPHGLLFPISSKSSFIFYMHHPTDRTIHTTTFVTPVVEHWLEREIAQWVHPMKDRSNDPLSYSLISWGLAVFSSCFNKMCVLPLLCPGRLLVTCSNLYQGSYYVVISRVTAHSQMFL